MSVAEVAEVIEIPTKSRVPATATVVDGVINHHGDILPVLDVDALLAIKADSNHRADGAAIGFIVGEGDGRMVLPIDATLGLAQLPLEGEKGEGLIERTVVVEGRVIAVLDVRQIVESVEEAVAAGWQ